uniref:Putative ovule protein n=1 Tax=Solanum chacoense TaxID=4108 RepID=A0A0V0H200_SOLCH
MILRVMTLLKLIHHQFAAISGLSIPIYGRDLRTVDRLTVRTGQPSIGQKLGFWGIDLRSRPTVRDLTYGP